MREAEMEQLGGLMGEEKDNSLEFSAMIGQGRPIIIHNSGFNGAEESREGGEKVGTSLGGVEVEVEQAAAAASRSSTSEAAAAAAHIIDAVIENVEACAEVLEEGRASVQLGSGDGESIEGDSDEGE